jgi:hypothetical protein
MTLLLKDRQSSVNQRHDGGDAGSRESRTAENPVAQSSLLMRRCGS